MATTECNNSAGDCVSCFYKDDRSVARTELAAQNSKLQQIRTISQISQYYFSDLIGHGADTQHDQLEVLGVIADLAKNCNRVEA